jgi:nitrite reductase (NADH) large subunit
MMWGAWTPHKVKLGVSGCPRNCAESSIKDIGIICIEAGYDISVGGNGGIELRGTEKLCQVTSEEEVLEISGAYLQLYREEARYLDRTAHWMARVGIDYVKRRIVEDAANRRDLYARFLHAQSFVQHDPWADRAAGVEAHEFRPMATVA